MTAAPSWTRTSGCPCRAMRGEAIGDIQGCQAKPAVAEDGARITAFRGWKSLQPAPLLNFIVPVPLSSTIWEQHCPCDSKPSTMRTGAASSQVICDHWFCNVNPVSARCDAEAGIPGLNPRSTVKLRLTLFGPDPRVQWDPGRFIGSETDQFAVRRDRTRAFLGCRGTRDYEVSFPSRNAGVPQFLLLVFADIPGRERLDIRRNLAAGCRARLEVPREPLPGIELPHGQRGKNADFRERLTCLLDTQVARGFRYCRYMVIW